MTSSGPFNVYYNRSVDGGANWLQDARLLNAASGVTECRNPEICCAGDRVYVAWAEGSVGAFRFYADASHDGGVGWLGNQRIDRMPLGASSAVPDVRIGCTATRVFTAWSDNRSGAYDIRFNDSWDGGQSWRSQDLRLDGGNPAGATNALGVQLCVDGARIHCCWSDERDGASTYGVYTNRRLP